MTIKEVQAEVGKERYDKKGWQAIVAVNGVETPLKAIEPDEETKTVKFIAGSEEEEAC